MTKIQEETHDLHLLSMSNVILFLFIFLVNRDMHASFPEITMRLDKRKRKSITNKSIKETQTY